MTMSMNRAESVVRTVVHVKPSVYVTGLMAAQRRGLGMGEFLEEALMNACASAKTPAPEQLPSGATSMALFLQVARHAPDALIGRWRILYERVVLDGALWTSQP